MGAQGDIMEHQGVQSDGGVPREVAWRRTSIYQHRARAFPGDLMHREELIWDRNEVL